VCAGVQSSIQAEPTRINIAPWSNNSFAAAPPSAAAVDEPASPSPIPAVVEQIRVPEPTESSPAPASPSPAIVEAPAVNNNSSMLTSEPAATNASVPTLPALTDRPTIGNISSDTASSDSAAPADEQVPFVDTNSYETDVGLPVPNTAGDDVSVLNATDAGLPAPNTAAATPSSPAVDAQQGGDSNTTVVWAAQPASPAPNTSTSAAAQEQLVGSDGAATRPSDVATPASPAVEEQPGNANATNARTPDPASSTADEAPAPTSPAPAAEEQQPASDTDAATAQPAASDTDMATPAEEQQLEDGEDTTVGYAVHTPSHAATTTAPSSPLPQQQPAANGSNTSAELNSVLQDGDTNNMTVVAASAPNAMVDPQRTPAVEDLLGNTAAVPSLNPTVVDLSAGSDKSSSTKEPFAQLASVQDEAPVDDISMVGPEGRTVTDLRSAGVEEKGQANKASSNEPATNRSKNDRASENDISVTELVSIPYTSLNSTS
jgi:hypothetical protein